MYKLDPENIRRLAAEADIGLTDTDLRLLETIGQLSGRIRQMTPEQKVAYGIPPDRTPQLKIGWELEFLVSAKAGDSLHLDEKSDWLVSQCPAAQDWNLEKHPANGPAIHKLEASGVDKPAEEAILDYFQFRKELKTACNDLEWTVRRCNNHLHYALVDENQNTLFTPSIDKEKRLGKAVNGNLLEALYDCLPMVVSRRQMMGKEKPRVRILSVSHPIQPEKSSNPRFYAIRHIMDHEYVERNYKGANPDSTPNPDLIAKAEELKEKGDYHFELRRTYPGPDNQHYLGFEPFLAASALLAGSVALAAEGREPNAVPSEWWGKEHFDGSCERMAKSEVAHAILDDALATDVPDFLLKHRHRSLHRQKSQSQADGCER